jgi:hypothetical protein
VGGRDRRKKISLPLSWNISRTNNITFLLYDIPSAGKHPKPDEPFVQGLPVRSKAVRRLKAPDLWRKKFPYLPTSKIQSFYLDLIKIKRFCSMLILPCTHWPGNIALSGTDGTTISLLCDLTIYEKTNRWHKDQLQNPEKPP